MTRLDEARIIEILHDRLGGIREDVEVFKNDSENIVVAIDTLVQSTDIPPGMRMEEISSKSVSACVSDFASKGVRPLFGTVSVTIPEGLTEADVTELSKGFQRASEEFGLKILGGDTSGGMELSISVALYGTADSIVPRGGAKVGDRIFVTGNFGNATAGLRLLLGKKSGNTYLDERYKEAFCSPRPPLDFMVRVARYLSASMDSSDGLAITLNEMSKQSKKRFSVTRLPFDETLQIFADRNNISTDELVLFGGEEYETIFTVPHINISKVQQIAKESGIEIIEIGTVELGTGVIDTSKNKIIPNRGWSHL